MTHAVIKFLVWVVVGVISVFGIFVLFYSLRFILVSGWESAKRVFKTE